MKTFVANGNSLQLVAGAGGVVGGSIIAQGKIVGVVVADAAEGEQFTLSIVGAHAGLPKAAGEAWAVGDMLYLKADGTSLTKTAAGNTFAGYAYDAAQNADVTGSILLSH